LKRVFSGYVLPSLPPVAVAPGGTLSLAKMSCVLLPRLA